jgi:hypothetical protein
MSMAEKIIIEGLPQFIGKHCETSSLKTVLDYRGLSLSEEMLLGLGGGVGFIYWYMKLMLSPFVGTRYGKVADFSTRICERIGAKATAIETGSSKKAHDELMALLRSGEPAICWVDMPYLLYLLMPEVAHFGGHVIVVFGIDEEQDKVYIMDRGKGPVTATISDLQKARGSKFPPYSPRNRLLKIKFPTHIANLENGIKEAIRDCCKNMLNPPIKNIGLAGMQKWANIITTWPKQFKGLSLYGCLFGTFTYIEIGGTGGSAFRPMYAQFLEESSDIINEPDLEEIATMFRDSARVWSEIATGVLPDFCPTLKRTRELTIEKNRLFEEQPPGYFESMRKVSDELESLKTVIEKGEDLQKAPEFLVDVKRSILKCYEVESKAFQKLSAVIK